MEQFVRCSLSLPETTGDCRYQLASAANSKLDFIFKHMNLSRGPVDLGERFVWLVSSSKPTQTATHAPDHSPVSGAEKTTLGFPFHFTPGATRALLSVSPNYKGDVTRMSLEPLLYITHHQMNT